jgi:hypothetical protein
MQFRKINAAIANMDGFLLVNQKICVRNSMQVNDITAQNGINLQTNRADKETAQKIDRANENKPLGVQGDRAIAEISFEFAEQVAQTGAKEFYTQSKLFFSPSNELKELTQENGENGAAKTTERLASLIFDAAEDDEGLLKSAKVGLFDGFEAAKEKLGGNAPQPTQKTLDLTIRTIDLRLHSLGFPLLSVIA